MVTIDNLRKRDLKSLTDYFDLMADKELLGSISEVRKMFKKLGKDQRIDCLLYIADRTEGLNDEHWKHTLDTCIREIYA